MIGGKRLRRKRRLILVKDDLRTEESFSGQPGAFSANVVEAGRVRKRVPKRAKRERGTVRGNTVIGRCRCRVVGKRGPERL